MTTRTTPFRRLLAAAATCLLTGLLAETAGGQSVTERGRGPFVGSWMLVSIHYVHADGTRIEPFGPGAKGMLVFDGNGHFSTQIISADRPKFKSNNRMIGTPDEFKAASQGVVAYFGTYIVSEAERLVTLHIERSSFPNWDGTDQKRTYAFAGDELRYTAVNSTANPAEAAQLVWKRAR